MLRLFRTRLRCFVAAILLAAGTTIGAYDELLHAGGSHDVACASVADVSHDPSSHRIDAAGDEAGHDPHCIGCHFARAPRLGAQPASFAGHAEEAVILRPAIAIGAARAAALDNLPPRSPPRR